MYVYLGDDTTTTTTPTSVQAPPPIRYERWRPRRQWSGPRFPQQPHRGQQQNTNGPQFYDAQMQTAAQEQQQAAPVQAQPQAQPSGWMSYLPQIAIGVGAALMVGMMTGKK